MHAAHLRGKGIGMIRKSRKVGANMQQLVRSPDAPARVTTGVRSVSSHATYRGQGVVESWQRAAPERTGFRARRGVPGKDMAANGVS